MIVNMENRSPFLSFSSTFSKNNLHSSTTPFFLSFRPKQVGMLTCPKKKLFVTSRKHSSTPEENAKPSPNLSEKKTGSRKSHSRKFNKKLREEEKRWNTGLITVNRKDGNWADAWHSEQTTNLTDLNLSHLALGGFSGEGRPRKDLVLVKMDVQKLGQGFYVRGNVHTSVLRTCVRCMEQYSIIVDAPFEVWLAPDEDKFTSSGTDNDDPSILHISGSQNHIDLTEVVRDNVHLSQASEAICSDICTKREPQVWQSEIPFPFPFFYPH